MKAFNFKVFIKPFEAPQRSVKIKISLKYNFQKCTGREGLISSLNLLRKLDHMKFGCVLNSVKLVIHYRFANLDHAAVLFAYNSIFCAKCKPGHE